MTFADTEFVLFDVETTGLSPTEGDRIVEFAALKFRRGQEVARLTSLVNPARALAAQDIHGITEDMLKGAPSSAEVLPQMIDFLSNACLVAHNASFDIKFLAYELALVGRRLHDETPVVDTVKMARAFLPHLTSYRLGYLATSLGINVGIAHRAEADTRILAQIFSRLLSMAPDYNVHTLSDLIERFGVEKPSFRLKADDQPSFF
jgi:DNA polymerase III epsilon subunit family exonuclease